MLRLLDPTSRTPCLVLDGTGLNDWLRCGQFYGFRHHVNQGGLVPTEEAIELTAGGAVHDALEARYKLRNASTPEMLAAMRTAQRAHWAASTCTPDWRCPDYVDTLLEAYLLEYPQEPFAVREVEAPFARSLGTVEVAGKRYGVLYQGRRDLVVSYSGTEGLEWVMDHKTTQSDNTNLPVAWGQSLSQLGYCWSRQQLTGRPVEGFIMNILGWRKPLGSPSKPSSLPRFFFKRVPMTVYPWQLEEWRQNVLGRAREIIGAMLADDWATRKNPNSCLAYNRQCAFWSACTSPPHVRARLLSSGEYRRNSWSPLGDGTKSNAQHIMQLPAGHAYAEYCHSVGTK